ncbi:M60 family metallopeptidase [Niameybacter massiliensis]|uniref:M60 family metallopeptidase n=1 Tax=Holtiella tumoricola TaxID=3018743 RepID=A0AA42DKR0_9FIRM|nr:M60 family metallopeptidase [Holtiella tumoricola]MDA3730800.1 M60 family metallopeptidase [Holtiella tumoricola]
MQKKIAWLLMSAVVTTSTLPAPLTLALPTSAYAQEAYGDLEVTVGFDYPLHFVDATHTKMQVTLLQDESEVFTLALGKDIIEQSFNLNGKSYSVTVSPQLKSDSTVQSYALNFHQLPVGDYRVQVAGDGYKTYTSSNMSLSQYSKHLYVNSANATFTAGDLNQDDAVSNEDLKLLEETLNQSTSNIQYDLNRDGLIDITDMTYIYQNIKATEGEKLLDTSLILGTTIDLTTSNQDLKDANSEHVTITGSLNNLLDSTIPEGISLTNTAGTITEESPVQIPIVFNEPVEMQQIAFTTPASEDGITKGTLIIEQENGSPLTYDYDYTNEPVATRSASFFNTQKEIVIPLGKQVAVKKITIQVTGTVSGKDTAAVTEIKFLKDIVDDAIDQEKGYIKNLTAKAGDEEVTLSWDRVPNASGYTIEYGTQTGNYTKTLTTSKSSMTIDGLENDMDYYFVVRATNGAWEGPISNEVSAMPKPGSAPAAPGGLSLIEGDGMLTVNWGASEGAKSYNLYYRKATDSSYTQIKDITSARYDLVGLDNDMTYYIYVTAVNARGESSPSAELVGIPSKPNTDAPLIPTYNQLPTSAITNIELVDPNNINLPHYPNGFDINNIIDGDFTTHWTAKGWGHNAGVRVTFDQPYDMNYVVLAPRQDGDFKRVLHYYSIKVWEDLESEPKVLVPGWTVIPGKDHEIVSKGYAVLPFPKSKVQKIEVRIRQWDGSPAGSLPTISEVDFYEYYGVEEELRALFTDDAYKALKSSVTLEEIEAIEAKVQGLNGEYFIDQDILLEEVKMAKALYYKEANALGPIVTVENTRNASSDRDRQFAYTLNDLQPIGAAVVYDQDKLNRKYPDHIVAYVNAPKEGSLPKLIFTQYYGEASKWQTAVELTPGRNVIEIPKLTNINTPVGGSLYLQYSGDQKDIEVHLEGVTKIPTLDVQNISDLSAAATIKSDIKDYLLALQAHQALLKGTLTINPLNSTEIGTDKVLLSLPSAEVLKAIQNTAGNDLDAQVDVLYNALITWDQTMNLHYQIAGLSEDATESKNRFPSSRINIRTMRMTKAFMYAGGAHIGIGHGSSGNLVTCPPDALSGYFGWGINHEIGHVLDMPRRTYGETTNNIFSLFAQTINDGPSRLETSNKYEDIYKKIVSENPGMATDVFVSLGLFWQLHLAYDYDEFVGTNAFYPQLHRLYRDNFETPSTNGDIDEKMNLLIRLASDVVGKDLTPFFEKWDIKISSDTKAYMSAQGYEKETRAIYYLNDEARRYKLADGPGINNFNLTASATKLDLEAHLDPAVEINIELANPSDAEHILGYEIYRNGKLIAFTTESTYIDEISSLNNVSLDYSVIAYDKLLNASSEVSCNSVYINYDGTLDKTGWNFDFSDVTTGSALTIDMQKVQTVTGLKVSDVVTTTSGAYTLLVSTDGENWTTAKASTLDSGDNYQYFNKPGTNSDDQRIWSYDARYIQIIGDIITILTPSQIDIITYPGDAIYFIEDGIGKLKHDFYIGDPDLENGILPKGSLVVVGNYRGNPVFNSMEIHGKYLVEAHGKEAELVEAPIAGDIYLFTEIPEDNQVSTIDQGIWIFVPSDQTLLDALTHSESEEHEETLELLTAIKAVLYRTSDASTTDNAYIVSDTPWIIPTAESLITLQ